jgi:hypothetical protein
MASLILGKTLAINESLMDLNSTDFSIKMERYGDTIREISFVNCVLEINRGLGKLKTAEKNNDLYYTRI